MPKDKFHAIALQISQRIFGFIKDCSFFGFWNKRSAGGIRYRR